MRARPTPPAPLPEGKGETPPISDTDRLPLPFREGGRGGRSGRTSDPDPRTPEDLIDAYLRRLAASRNLSPYTLRNYRTDLDHFAGWWLAHGSGDLLVIDRRGFRQYLAALDADGVARGSVARKVSTIHTFYRDLVSEGVLATDPLHQLRPPKQAKTLPRVLHAPEIALLLAAPDAETEKGVRDRAILELLYAAGVRVSELARLDLGDVDLHERSARVRGKGNKERIVLLGEPAERALRAYLKTARPRFARDPAQRALFLNKNSGRLSVRAVEVLVRAYALAAGIDQRTFPHLLRHTFATHLLDGGADVRVVQELLGHASATTTQIYTHVTEQRQQQVYTDAFYNQWQPRKGGSGAGSREPEGGAAQPYPE